MQKLDETMRSERSARKRKSRNRFTYLFVSVLAIISLLGNGTSAFSSEIPTSTQVINVKEDFNARGDGVRNDTAAIQAAIDAVEPGGTLVIPPGAYNVNANMNNKVNTNYGRSYFSLKISKPMTIIMDGAVFLMKTKDMHGVFWIYKTSDVHLKGGSIKGDVMPKDGILSSRVGVLVQESRNCSIENMYTTNLSQGINIYRSYNCAVRNVFTENNRGSGIINLNSDYTLIESCKVINSGDGHLSLYGGGSNNTVRNCIVVENRLGNNGQQGITLENEHNSYIYNNTVKGFYYGIDIKNGTESCSIVQNTAFNNQYNIAIRLGDPSQETEHESHNIMLYKNNVRSPKIGSANAGILIKAGRGHIVQENVVDTGKIMYFGAQINSDIEINGNNFTSNTYVD
ncbi:right-handed parallel beta-helix repeat-containing protein [Paenibacillus solisilvae]|uniref:Right-handed parallel beta-helix repeat-containing protein n=1 Tax=Paenibacillus solisilvae TaxID=2486751 RepID=A0ABW0W848_9BACL